MGNLSAFTLHHFVWSVKRYTDGSWRKESSSSTSTGGVSSSASGLSLVPVRRMLTADPDDVEGWSSSSALLQCVSSGGVSSFSLFALLDLFRSLLDLELFHSLFVFVE